MYGTIYGIYETLDTEYNFSRRDAVVVVYHMVKGKLLWIKNFKLFEV